MHAVSGDGKLPVHAAAVTRRAGSLPKPNEAARRSVYILENNPKNWVG
jgi:hypothetical protein